MLLLEKPFAAIPGVSVFRDHQEADQFYFINERPRIAMHNGVPAIHLTKFKRDLTDNPDFQDGDNIGGGTLSFTVDLHLNEDELDDVRDAIEDHFEDSGDIKLGQVSFRSGTVRLSGVDDENQSEAPDGAFRPTSFEKIYGSTKPSLIGDNSASFTIPLGMEQATYFEKILRGGATDISVFYDLKYVGISPAIEMKAKADFSRIYNSLEAKFGVQGQIKVVSLALDVEAAFQHLREEGAIEVEITQFTDDADMQKKGDEAWTWFKTFLTEKFFSSHMPPQSAPAAGGNILDRLTTMFGAMPQTAAITQMQPTQTGSNGTPNTAAPAQGLSDQVPSTVQTTPAQAGARTSGGGASGGNLASQLSPFRIGLSLKFMRQDERVTRTFDFRLQSAFERNANPNQSLTAISDGYNMDKLITTVDLDDPFFDRIITNISMGQDLQALGIGSVAMNLEYPAEVAAGGEIDHVDGFLFRPDQVDVFKFTTFLNQSRDRDFRYNMTITFEPNSEWAGADSQIKTPWVTTREREITLAPIDAVERMEIDIGLSTLLNDNVSLVEVDVEYENPNTGFTASETFPLGAGLPSHSWKLRLADNAPLNFRHRERFFFKEGNVEIETPWEDQLTQSVIVNPPFKGQQRLMINPMLLDAANLLQAIVDVEYIESDTGYRVTFREIFNGTEPLAPRSKVIDTLAADPAPIVYSLTLIKLDGTVFTLANQEVDTGVILLTEGDGVIQRVNVRLPGATLGTDQIAIKVDLLGDPSLGDHTSVLFTSEQMGAQTIALVQPDGASRQYTFTVTAYDLFGVATIIHSGDSQDTTFIVPI